MGKFIVDNKFEPGVLHLRVSGKMSDEEAAAFLEAHNKAIDDFGTRDYKVFCDLREMMPLSPKGTEYFELAKKYSSSKKNFRGSAVWVTSAIMQMQHHRTSVTGGVANTELISSDEKELRAHLDRVHRS